MVKKAVSNAKLISLAAAVIAPKRVGNCWAGQAGAALVTAIAISISLSACGAFSAKAPANQPAAFQISPAYFQDMDACAIVFDAKAEKPAAVFGDKRCRERYTAASTFKVALAVMAFDSGLLKDESTPFKWDGVKRWADSWNQDQTAASWMRNSVVWCSQELASKLGKETIQGYLKALNYGNQDISSGLAHFWLTVTRTDTGPGRGSLKISTFEELSFFRRFWGEALPVSKIAMEKTKKLLFLEVSPEGYTLHGKTGSGYLDGLSGDFGWFVGHAEGKGSEFFMVISITRRGKAADARIPGVVAKEIAKSILKDNSAW